MLWVTGAAAQSSDVDYGGAGPGSANQGSQWPRPLLAGNFGRTDVGARCGAGGGAADWERPSGAWAGSRVRRAVRGAGAEAERASAGLRGSRG